MIFAAPVQRARLGNAAGCDAFLLSTTPVDPLAGLTWSARLQTHNGDNVPLGLYQDTACTIPATEDFDTVAAWRGEFATGTITLIQADEAKQPYLLFVSGVPTIQFDGVDDYLAGSAIVVTSTTLLVAVQLPGSASSWNLVSTSVLADFWRYNGDGSGYMGAFRSARLETYPLVVPNTGSHVFAVNSSAATYRIWIDGTDQGAQAAAFSSGTTLVAGAVVTANANFFEGGMTAVLASTGVLNDTDRGTAQTYLADINS